MKVLMTLLLLALGVNAASLDDLTYTTAGGKVTITDCDTGATGELVIPDTIGGNPVTSIGRQAFRWCGGLTNVIIPNSVTSIGIGAFQRCTSLINITISEGVTSIELGSFQDCRSLTSITIPDSVTSIGSGAFINCNSLTSINFLGAVAPSLGDRVFENISNEPTYISPAGATGYSDPFGGISTGVDTDGDGYFDINDAFPDDSTEWADTDGDGVGNNADTDDDGDGVVDANDAFPNDSTETVDTDGDGVGDNTDDSDGDGVVDANDTFPNDATETKDTDSDGVGNNADLDDDGDGVDDDRDSFPNDSTETKDTDGDGIGDNGDIFADFDDSLITYSDEGGSVTITDCETSASGSLIIPNTINDLPVNRIGNSAFFNCEVLTSIIIPDSVTSIEDYAFSSCTALTSIRIPDSITSIGKNAFEHCTSLTSITIPDSVTSIGDYAFYNCNSLTSITIPDSVTSIGLVAFLECSALTTIEVSDENVNYTDADGVLFNDEMTLLATYPAGKTDSDYTIPEGVTNIGAGAFLYCDNLKSVTLPQSVTNIGGEAFAECGLLKNLFMDGPPPSVGSSAFENLAPNALVNVKREWRANYGAAGNTWYGLFVVEQDEEECDNEELTNTITTLVALLAQKDAQIAEKNAQIEELEKRPSLEDIQEARSGSVVLTPTGNGTVILRMMIEESSDLSVWENSEESIEVELPLAEGKKFLRFALK
ncbi:leucine-rich repeat domain-containing protein [bacterium]|nr:leucine-rich repeat domain-containing protein [bacterium]